MKDKKFHMADNTVLDCPTIDYKYNTDTYLKEKKAFWIISIIGFVVALLIVVFCKNAIIQTIAGAFMGGILSLFVWLFTIRQQDNINFELANIDMHIMKIDDYLSELHYKVKFINPEEYDIVQADSKPLVYRFMHLFKLTISLQGDNDINCSRLLLKFSDDNEYTLEKYIEKCETLCENHFTQMLILQEKWDKVIEWNYYTIDRHLNELKKKLVRYKSYILCGNAPERYIDDINK